MEMKTVREVIRRDGKHEEPKSESGMQQNINEIVSFSQRCTRSRRPIL